MMSAFTKEVLFRSGAALIGAGVACVYLRLTKGYWDKVREEAREDTDVAIKADKAVMASVKEFGPGKRQSQEALEAQMAHHRRCVKNCQGQLKSMLLTSSRARLESEIVRAEAAFEELDNACHEQYGVWAKLDAYSRPRNPPVSRFSNN